MLGLNPSPEDQKLQAFPTEPGGHPYRNIQMTFWAHLANPG